jgi:hypothetical protein
MTHLPRRQRAGSVVVLVVVSISVSWVSLPTRVWLAASAHGVAVRVDGAIVQLARDCADSPRRSDPGHPEDRLS